MPLGNRKVQDGDDLVWGLDLLKTKSVKFFIINKWMCSAFVNSKGADQHAQLRGVST